MLLECDVHVMSSLRSSQRDGRVAETHRYGSNAQEVLASGCLTEIAVARHDNMKDERVGRSAP
ncbi:hypothetical protein M422DRAFT_27647, partial [Sphaerobolus stellatus SS14]